MLVVFGLAWIDKTHNGFGNVLSEIRESSKLEKNTTSVTDVKTPNDIASI